MKLLNKKLMSMLILILLVFSVAGCATTGESPSTGEPSTSEPSTSEPSDESTPVATENYQATILGGSAGGMWSVITEGVAESIRRGMSPDSRITTEPGKDGPNHTMVNRGEIELAVGYEATAVMAMNGIEAFSEKHNDLVGVAVLSPIMPFQFFVDNKTGLTSMDELAIQEYPLRVSPNQAGSLMEIVTRKALEAHNASYENIKSWGGNVDFLPNTQAMANWDMGLLDAVGEVAQYPLSAYVEFSMKNDISLMTMNDDEVINQLAEELGMTPYTIPANSYTFQPEDIKTIKSQLILMANKDLDETMVYEIVKAMHSNLNYLNNVHISLSTLDGKKMAEMNVPLHSGAVKFYKEAGYID